MRLALLATALLAALAADAAADPLPADPPRVTMDLGVQPDCVIVDPPVVDVECIPLLGGT